VRVATRKICDPLEEDAFRPILHHYDGPKFRLELSITEVCAIVNGVSEASSVHHMVHLTEMLLSMQALSLLDIFEDKDDA
jgi:uncharacterized protein (UPF0262 family)